MHAFVGRSIVRIPAGQANSRLIPGHLKPGFHAVFRPAFVRSIACHGCTQSAWVEMPGWMCRWAIDGAGGEGDGTLGGRIAASLTDFIQCGAPTLTPFIQRQFSVLYGLLGMSCYLLNLSGATQGHSTCRILTSIPRGSVILC